MSKQDNFLDLKLYKNQQKQLLLDRIKPNFRNNNQLEIIHNIIDKCETKFDVDQIVFLLTSKEESNFISDESLVIESEQTITILEKDLKLSFYASQRERERERESFETRSNKDFEIHANNIYQQEREREREHKLIIGDNYDALNNLLVTHKNFIDVIYIDPPYNTGSSNLFYVDKFSKKTWLSFMKERIILARDLLAESGIIFISLDDNMQAYFKVLMDEIFGEENFVSTIIWQNTTGTNDALFLKETTEYIIMYAKNKKKFKINKIIKDVKNDKSFKYQDKHFQRRGMYKLNSLDNASHSYSKGLDFPIIIDDKIYYAGKSEDNYKKRHNGIHAQKDWRWMWSKEKVHWRIKNDYIVACNGTVKHKVYQFVDNSDNLVTKTQHFLNLILVNEFSNLMGTTEQKKIFQRKVFDHPKPSKLIKHLINSQIELTSATLM